MGNSQSMPGQHQGLSSQVSDVSPSTTEKEKRFSRIKFSSNNSYSISPSSSLLGSGRNKDVPEPINRLTVGGWDSETDSPSPTKEPVRRRSWQPIISPVQSPSDENKSFEAGVEAIVSPDYPVNNDRLGRTLSQYSAYYSAVQSTTQLLADSQPEMAQDQRNVDMQTAIRLLEELKKTASPEDLVALHRALLPSKSTDQLSAIVQTPTDDPNPVVVRKRSFIKPMASRKIVKRKLTTQKKSSEPVVSPIEPPQDLPWKPEMITTSPLDRLSSMDVDRETALQWGPRAETPANMDYASLGNYQIGTLVVTNGTASPTPSLAPRPSTPLFPALDTAFSSQASDVGVATPVMSMPTPRLGYSDTESIRVPSYSAEFVTDSVGQIQPSKPWLESPARDRSPLRRAWDADSIGLGNEEDEDANIERPLTATKKRSNFLAQLIDAERSDLESGRLNWNIGEAVTTDAEEDVTVLANEYQADLPPSPFGSTEDITRQETPVADYHSVSSLAYEDAAEPEDQPTPVRMEENRQAALEALEYKTPPHASMLRRDITPETALASHPVVRPRSPVSPIEEDEPSFPLATVKHGDSGYSSGISANGSTRHHRGSSELSLVHPPIDETSELGRPITRDQTRPDFVMQNQPSVEEIGTARVVMLRSQTMPTEAPKPLYNLQQALAVNPADFGRPARDDRQGRSLTKAVTSVETPEPKKRSKSWRKSVRKSLPRLFSTEDLTERTEKTPEPVSAPLPENRKLQKRRPGTPKTPGTPVLNNPHLSLSEVPDIPLDIFARFAGRRSVIPGEDSSDSMYMATHKSKEDLQKRHTMQIPPAMPISFPDSNNDSNARTGRGLTRAGSEEPQVHPSRPFAFGIRRSSRSRHRAEQEVHGFRYENQPAAQQPQVKSQQPTSYNDIPQLPPFQYRSAERVTGMDDKTASEFAQIRSRERANDAVMPRGRRPDAARPYSYYEGAVQPVTMASAGAQDHRQPGRPRSLYDDDSARRARSRPRTADDRSPRPAEYQAEPAADMPTATLPNLSLHMLHNNAPPSTEVTPRMPANNQRVSAMPRRPFSMVAKPSHPPSTYNTFYNHQTPSRASSIHDELPSQQRRRSMREPNADLLKAEQPTQPADPMDDSYAAHEQPMMHIESNASSTVASEAEQPVNWDEESRRWRERKNQAAADTPNHPTECKPDRSSMYVSPTSTTVTTVTMGSGYTSVTHNALPKLQRTSTAPAPSSSEYHQSEPQPGRRDPFARRSQYLAQELQPQRMKDAQAYADNMATHQSQSRPSSRPSSRAATDRRPISILKQSSSTTNLNPNSMINTREVLRPSVSSSEAPSRVPSSIYSVATANGMAGHLQHNYHNGYQSNHQGPEYRHGSASSATSTATLMAIPNGAALPNVGSNTPAVAKYAEEGIFGRYGGGFRHSAMDFNQRHDPRNGPSDNGAHARSRSKSFVSGGGRSRASSRGRVPSGGSFAMSNGGREDWAPEGQLLDSGVELVDVPVLRGSLSLVGTGGFR